eukprot:TRINITY_DN39083_c0_g1_i1.p1 TRINITY_DN39083_c0_g1~~TRINITY_DN39083_c0_g1_i1.p1  ORF type:complete len:103 (+),score=26.44 TRINITY_DN39083_c0_g1_i1:227-535(+)
MAVVLIPPRRATQHQHQHNGALLLQSTNAEKTTTPPKAACPYDMLLSFLDTDEEEIAKLREEARDERMACVRPIVVLSLIHISEPTRLLSISYAVFCLKKKN